MTMSTAAKKTHTSSQALRGGQTDAAISLFGFGKTHGKHLWEEPEKLRLRQYEEY